MSKNEYLQEIESFIASCFDVFTSLHGFHWNVEGESFFDLHDFFKECYDALHENIDDFAERLRTFDLYAPGSLSEMKQLSLIKTHAERKLNATKMLEIFCENTIILVNQAKHLMKLSEQAGDLVTQDMFIGFIQDQEKKLWMARSYLKN